MSRVRDPGLRLSTRRWPLSSKTGARPSSYGQRSTNLSRTLDPSYDWQRFEQQLGHDVERDRDQGHER